LEGDLVQAAAAAASFAAPGERVEAVLAAEPASGERFYVCAFVGEHGRTWIALAADGTGVTSRTSVREAVSIAALCEIADELAGIEPAPRVATPRYLDKVASPDLAAALGTVEALTAEVESSYKLELS